MRTIVAGLAGGAMVHFARRTIENVDALGKTAQKLGLTAEEYSRLEFAASQAGLGSKQFATGLQRLTRRLAEVANTGKGEATEALETLGVSAKELLQLRPEKRMIALADAFNKVGSQSERVRLAFKLFDTEGVDFVNLLGQGADNMQMLFDEADKLGITVSQLDTTRAAMLNDLMDKLRRTVGGLWRSVLLKLTPGLIAAGEALLDLTSSGQGLGRTMGTAFEYVKSILKELVRWAFRLKAVWTGVGGSFNQLSSGLVEVMAEFADYAGYSKNIVDSLRDSAQDLADDANSAFAQAFREWDQSSNKAELVFEKIENRFENIAAKAKEIAKASTESAMALGSAGGGAAAGLARTGRDRPAIAAVEAGTAAQIELARRAFLPMRDELAVQQEILQENRVQTEVMRKGFQLFGPGDLEGLGEPVL
jgi:hypothetical protein